VAPGRIWDLSTFYLQLPKSRTKADGSKGITTIKMKDNRDFEEKPYFYTDRTDNGTIMFAPENGFLTDNGSGPRTEFTEKERIFKFEGNHKMKFTTEVLQLPASKEIAIGQIKGNNGKRTSAKASCLIVVEFMYDGRTGECRAHYRKQMENGKCQSVREHAGFFKLNEKIEVTFEVVGSDVFVATNKVKLPRFSYKQWKGTDYNMQFKVGTYNQGTGSSSTKGGRVKLHNLRTEHSSFLKKNIAMRWPWIDIMYRPWKFMHMI